MSSDLNRKANTADVYTREAVDALLAGLQAAQLTSAQIQAIVAAIPTTPVTQVDIDRLDAALTAATSTLGGKADKVQVATDVKAAEDRVRNYVDNELNQKADKTALTPLMPKGGGVFTGPVSVPTATAATHPVTKAVYDQTAQQVAAAATKVSLDELRAEVAVLRDSIRQPSPWYNSRNLDLGSSNFQCRTEWIGDTKFLRLAGFITGPVPEDRWTNAVMPYANRQEVTPGSLVGQTAVCPTDNPRRLCLVRLVKGSDGETPIIQVRPIWYTTGEHTHAVTTSFSGTLSVQANSIQHIAPITNVDLHNTVFDLTHVSRTTRNDQEDDHV